MTATVPTVDTPTNVYRGTSNIALPADVSQEIWSAVLEESAFMQLSRQITIPGTGTTIQTITGEPAADWVSETAAKPVSTHTFNKKSLTPYKLAVIEPFSMEFIRDKNALYDECVRRLPFAIAAKFDSTIMGTSAPGTGFDVLGAATAVSLNPGSGSTVYDQFVTVDGNIAAAGGIMNGIVLAPQGKSKLLGAVDGDGHPLFTAGVDSGELTPILGAKTLVNKHVYKAGTAGSSGTPAVIGIAGDFSDAVYGIVEGINIDISRDATLVTTGGVISLFQQNMVAVRVEAEVAFGVKSASEFNLLTGDVPSA
ncbi:MAG: phage major capsid protein [Eggerthellaceae bacterium]|nr:phage major capsid protein [Eggerthellaceae bacterium]